ncbi:MAG: glycosyltransferase [Candidatus Sumerlaeaceae bacterium]|nr:glycosyltransferase [Candidatus Sumerlaeaceae bacterium]
MRVASISQSSPGSRPLVILALPAYNEAENLRPLIESAALMFESEGLCYRIIVLDDGSTDATAQVLADLSTKLPLERLAHEKNRGLGAAIRSLIAAALERSLTPDDAVVFMDADNTHDPAYIPQMVKKLWDGPFDVVIASRFRDGSEEVGVPWQRRLLSRGARWLFRIFLRLPEVTDYTCGYRVYRSGLLRAAYEKYGERIITREGFACTDELLVHLSTLSKKMTEVPFVLRYDRKRGRSKLPLFRTVYETLKMLLFRD